MTGIAVSLAIERDTTGYFAVVPRERPRLPCVTWAHESESERLRTEVVWPSSGHGSRRPRR